MWKPLVILFSEGLDKIHIVEVRIAESSTAEGGQEELGPEIVLRHPQGSGLVCPRTRSLIAALLSPLPKTGKGEGGG